MVKIIAEICQNHKGSRAMLQEMIAAAAEAGADYVKMQSIFSDDLTFRERFEEGKTDPDGTVQVIKRPYAAEKKRLAALDLTEDDHRYFIEECAARGVTPFTTVFARSRVPFAASLPWPVRMVKVASYDCASYPLLKDLCASFDHLVISSGAMEDDEIEKAAKLVKDAGKELTLLHCVTSYPNTLDMCHLARMDWLRQFTQSVGWSDHTLVERDGIKAAKAAIALGAEWIERHFTILEKDQTKDGPVSIRPEHIKELRAFGNLPREEQMKIAKSEILDWDAVIGKAQRPLSHVERLNRDYYRGRFASKKGEEVVYNWEEQKV